MAFSLYGYVLALWLMILLLFMPTFSVEEGSRHARHDALQTDQTLFFAYNNHVRSVLRSLQEENAFTHPESGSVGVYGVSQAPTVIEPPANQRDPDYLTAHAIRRLGLGNILAKDDKGIYRLYVWMHPDNPDLEGSVKRQFARDGESITYVRRGADLILANRPGESIPIAGAALDYIPEGALVMVSQPIEHGPVF